MYREAVATPPFQRALVGAAAIMLTCSPAGGCGRPALHCGDTVTIGDRDTFLVALVERGHGLFAERLAGLDVTFHADGEKIAHARADKLGLAVAVGRVPANTSILEARASLDGHELSAQGDVLPWEQNRTILVCDIDGTISETDVDALLFDRRDTGSRPLPGAAKTLRSFSDHFNILFLTGRPLAWRNKTRKWLDDQGFPTAPVILAPDVREAVDVEQFKANMIAKVRRLYPNALIGIGNAETDSDAYNANGMLTLLIDDGTRQRKRSKAIAFQNWAQVRRFFGANSDMLRNPAKMQSLVSNGGLLQYPQQEIAKTGNR